MLDMIRAAIRDHFITTTLIRIPPFHIEERGPFRTKERKIRVSDLEILGMFCWTPEDIWEQSEDETEKEYHQRLAELDELDKQTYDCYIRLKIRTMVKAEKKNKKILWEEWFKEFYDKRWLNETEEEYKIRMEKTRTKVLKYKKWKEEEEQIESLPWYQKRKIRKQEAKREIDLSGAKYEEKPRFKMPKSEHPRKVSPPYQRPKASKSAIEIVEMEEKTFYGVWKKSNKKTMCADRAELYKKYYMDFGVIKLPYIVLAQNYNCRNKEFELFMEVQHDKVYDLNKVILPAGEYAKVAIEPKLIFLWRIIVKIKPIKKYIKNFLWNLSIKEAKRYFYKKWIPKSPYRALNFDYELYGRESIVLRPLIYIVYAIEKK